MRKYVRNYFMRVIAGISCAFALAGVPARAWVPGMAENDIRFEELIAPAAWDGSDSTLYRDNNKWGISIKARFVNAGSRTQHSVEIVAQVRDATGSIIARGKFMVNGEWEPGESRVVEFENVFEPSWFGTYYVEAFAVLKGDEIKGNDSSPLRTVPWFAHGSEIRPGLPEFTAMSPLPGRTYDPGYTLLPHATFINSGADTMTGAIGRMVIHDPNGSVIYDRTAVIGSIGPRGGVIKSNFPDSLVLNGGLGTYTVILSGYHPADPIKNDDTARWEFEVASVAGVRERIGMASAAMIAVHPNPAHEDIRIIYGIPAGTEGRLRLYDADGREIPVPACMGLSAGGTISIPASLLPSGLYTIALEFPDGSRRSSRVIVRR